MRRSIIFLVVATAFSTAALAQVGTEPTDGKIPANQVAADASPPTDAATPALDDAAPADRAGPPANVTAAPGDPTDASGPPPTPAPR